MALSKITSDSLASSNTLVTPVVSGLMDLQGGQIKFPSTQNPSSNANTLDDYEEGTWTPTLTGSGVWPTVSSYNNQYAHYRKIGSLVFVSFYLYITAGKVSGGSGAIQISGLPFNIKGGGNAAYNVISGGYLTCNGSVDSPDSAGTARWQCNGDNGNYLTLYGTQTTNWGAGVYELSGSGCYMAYNG